MGGTAEIFQVVNDYISHCVDLRALDTWMSDHIEQLAVAPDGDRAGDLWAFIQVRIYQHQDGFLPEDTLRADVAAYLAEHPLPKREQRAAG